MVEDIQMVIMEKDPATGFLERELGSYFVPWHELIVNAYAEKGQSQYIIHMKVSCERELEDWEYNAVFDYYDGESLMESFGLTALEEVEDHYNPTWEMVFPYLEDKEQMEDFLDSLMQAHYEELESVYEAIQDKKKEYLEALEENDGNGI